MKEIGDVLKGTKFEELIPKIESSGYKDLKSLGRLKNTEGLLEFLKTFESGDRLFELSKLINDAVDIYQKKNMNKFLVFLVVLILGGFSFYLFLSK
jgi:hypothetical protein